MMDNYVKMCSLLEPLQATKDKNLRRIIIPLEDSGIGIDDGGNVWVVCPDLEQLIVMLEGKCISLEYVGKWIVTIYEFRNAKSGVAFDGKTHKIAMLKLVAYELYGLTWDDKGVRWE